MCDIGQVNLKEGNPKWIKPKMTIDQHLDYKFILSLEGTDVATNLKWIMSSNSIAIAPPHKMETWYMEGTLIPNEHFIQIADDFSDLDEKLEFYTSNPKAALEIVGNAKRFRSNFSNENLEDLIALLVLKKYFEQVD
ncbi:glycosyl transferase family 90 [Soonwooa sp.]|uniref:glycosyl transferase family 90 n=1 Tax=Soonwooa sp. TaxID=1938592 RepID=UPI0035B47312